MGKLANKWFFSDVDPTGQLDDFVRTILGLVSGRLDGGNLAEYITLKNVIIQNDESIDDIEYNDHILYMEVMG